MSTFNVFRDGKVHIQRAMCPTCIFRPGSPIPQARRDEMRAAAEAAGSTIVCHETLATDNNAACRGHLDAGCPVLSVAAKADVVEWVREVWPESTS